MTEVSVPTAAPAAPESAPAEPTPNMTGEEAKAWVEAQKGKGPPPKDPGREAEKKPDLIKEAIAEAKRKIKISDDEEVDEDEVIKTYKDRKGHQQAANKILQEGKLARKQAEEFLTMMRDPEKFFDVAKQLGLDPRTLAEKRLAAELEEEMLDPREKEFRAMKRELDSRKAQEAQKAKEEQERVHNALKEKYHKDYNDQFVAALQSTNLPPTKQTIADMARYVARAAELKFELTPAEAAQLVKDDIQAKTQRLFAEADGDVLINLLGEQVANKVRKWDTSRVKSPEQNLRTPLEQGEISQKTRGAPKKRMSPSEWRRFNGR